MVGAGRRPGAAEATTASGGGSVYSAQPPRPTAEPTLRIVPLTWLPDPGQPLSSLYPDAARALAEGGLEIIQEKLFASPDALPELLASRATAWEAADIEGPVTIITNPAVDGRPVAGLQILATDMDVGPVHDGVDVVARLVRPPTGRMMVVSDVQGRGSDGQLLEGPRAQMDGMFTRLEELFEVWGFAFTDVVRTWIYVDPLLETYGELNASRDALFDRTGVRVDGVLEAPPASTGIQGVHPDGALCFADALATHGLPFRPIRPAHQPEAWDYGSAFSRGMVGEVGDGRLITVSGTASINPDGHTEHPGDARAQILLTWHNISALLGSEGVEPTVSGLWTLYFKDASVVEAWAQLEAEGAVPALAAVRIIADVCRDDLLFEAEVTAFA